MTTLSRIHEAFSKWRTWAEAVLYAGMCALLLLLTAITEMPG